MANRQALEQLAEWIKGSSYTVLLTGAGMSTESGIPDFRSQNGLWKNYDPAYVSSVEALHRHYDVFHEFYSLRLNDMERLKPHSGYSILSKWQQQSMVHAVATQNVDGFHKKSGAHHVFELHGSLDEIYCHECGSAHSRENFRKGEPCDCGGRLRPGIVLFGELLPEKTWESALASIEKADLVIVIGTSLQVYPVNQLPSLTSGKTVLINREPTTLDHLFTMVIHSGAKDTLIQLDEIIQDT
ncbi:SIR2 family NAD-dependent protein deacylase [Fictibacillus sp. FJAT-27399]|uniref:SIR2 family NAD-dependent protein deacylase n=1 Tax=Fictibacillus sp. FJAT-27399 TaxID=1729689 RepID=UPI00078070DC|nr:NAD-dependent deacylase [Fictibacillus sp. FJAT-27399]